MNVEYHPRDRSETVCAEMFHALTLQRLVEYPVREEDLEDCLASVAPVHSGGDVVCTGKSQGKGFREQMKKELERQVAAIEGLKGKAFSASPDFVSWRKETEVLLKRIFGEASAEVQDFNAIYYTPVFLTCRMGDEAFDEAYRNGLVEARALLLSLMEKINRPV